MYTGIHGEAERSKQRLTTEELLEEVKWLVPLISNLKMRLRDAKKRESAERNARMMNMVSQQRKFHEEKLKAAHAQESAASSQDSEDEWKSEDT